MMYGYYNRMYGGGFDWFFSAILFMFLIFAGIQVMRHFFWHSSDMNSPHQHNNSALDILKERYAKGEINKEEFEQKKKDLSS